LRLRHAKAAGAIEDLVYMVLKAVTYRAGHLGHSFTTKPLLSFTIHTVLTTGISGHKQ
jgi:hypothetical protein